MRLDLVVLEDWVDQSYIADRSDDEHVLLEVLEIAVRNEDFAIHHYEEVEQIHKILGESGGFRVSDSVQSERGGGLGAHQVALFDNTDDGGILDGEI